MISVVFILIIILAIIAGEKKLSYGCALIIAIRILIPPIARIGPLSMNSTCTLVMIFICLLSCVKLEEQRRILKNSLFPLLILIIPLAIIGLFATIDYGFQYKTLGQFLYTEIMLFFIVVMSVKNAYDYRIIIKAVGVAYLIAGVYGIITYFFMFNPYCFYIAYIFDYDLSELALGTGEETVRGALFSRATGTYLSSLQWGQLSLVLLLLFSFDKDSFSLKYRYLLVVLTATNIFLSGHRSCILPMIFVISFLVLKCSLQKTKYLLLSIIILIIVCVGLSTIKGAKDYIKNIQTAIFFWDDKLAAKSDMNGSSKSMRTIQFNYSFYMIRNNPLTGLGYGYPKYYNVISGGRVHPKMWGFESIIFEVVVSSGLIGIFVWAWFFSECYKKTKLNCKDRDNFVMHGAYLLSLLLTGTQISFFMYMILVGLRYRYKSFKKEKIKSDI